MLRQILPWQMNNIFIISLISLQKPSNLDITGFPALFSIFVFCLKFTLFFVNLRKFTGKWCSNWCSNLVHFQPDFLCFSGVTVPLKSMISPSAPLPGHSWRGCRHSASLPHQSVPSHTARSLYPYRHLPYWYRKYDGTHEA